MLSREFTRKEKILLVICFLLVLGIIYYQFVYKGILQQIPENSTADLELEIEMERARSTEISNMLATIDQNKGKTPGKLMVYNNLANEINLVGEVMQGKGEQVTLNWSTPVLNGTIVRRDVSVSLVTRRYSYLKEILHSFNNCVYRCVVRDLAITDNSAATRTVTARIGGNMTTMTVPQTRRGIKDSTRMSVSFNMTFFETIEGATSTEGLIIESSSNGTDEPGVLETRAKAYTNS